MTREQQIEKIAGLLANIHVPASGGYPEVNMSFIGPVARIAEWMWEQGVRVESGAVESDVSI